MSIDKAGKRVRIEKKVLSKNDELAALNREKFSQHGLFVVNLISSPGSGKTTLLETLARKLGKTMAVIVGDLQTERDAERISAAGCKAIQIETGGSCHLDAERVGKAFNQLEIDDECGLLIIENVGNLVCPAGYDLGEHVKMSLLSLPEGDDKVLKYPSIFRRVGIFVTTKIDLAPYMDFDIDRAESEVASINEDFAKFRVSSKTGAGIDELCSYLLDESRLEKKATC